MNPVMNERDIFLHALDKPTSVARDEYLDQACEGNIALRNGVVRLLQAAAGTGEFLEQPPGLALTIRTDDGNVSGTSLDDLSLDFLTPSDKPGCFGTIGIYEIVGLVGRGGFGLVLRAYDTKLNRIVAIKVMAPELAINPVAVKRFLREAQAAAAVRHDHVVTIHAIEETSRPPFIVMEYIEGQSLKERVDEAGELELTEILRIGTQMALGLAAAHRQGLVHRDIKPANVLLENGIKRVKITDFGLARAVDDVGMTQSGMIAGTPQYMSPEQGLGKAVDARSDLFSLGSVLYTLCTGRPAFRANSAVATLRRVCDESPRPIRDINTLIPEWFQNIVMRLLEKSADDRIQSADEVAEVLGACLAHVQSSGGTTPLPNELATVPKAPVRIRESSPIARRFFIGLVGFQILAIPISLIAAYINVETIGFTGPVFGLLVGLSIAAFGVRTRVAWPGVAFGLSAVALTLCVFAAIIIFRVSPSAAIGIQIALTLYTLVAVPWGSYVLYGTLKEDRSGQVGRRLLTNHDTYVLVFAIQLFAIAVATVAVAIEIEAILVTGVVIGIALGSVLSLLTCTAGKQWASRAFAVSGPIFCVGLWCLILAWSLPTVNPLGAEEQFVVRLVLVYSIIMIPIGVWALAKEVRLIDRRNVIGQFNLRSALIATTAVAFAFASARTCFAFGAEAYLAGILFVLTLLAVAGLLGYWSYKRENKRPVRQWLALAAGTLAVQFMFMGIVAWHYASVDTGYINIKTRINEQVIAIVTHVPSGRHFGAQIGPSGVPGFPVRSGEFELSVAGRKDLQFQPSNVTLKRNEVVTVRLLPIE